MPVISKKPKEKPVQRVEKEKEKEVKPVKQKRLPPADFKVTITCATTRSSALFGTVLYPQLKSSISHHLFLITKGGRASQKWGRGVAKIKPLSIIIKICFINIFKVVRGYFPGQWVPF